MKVIIAGSRSITNYEAVKEVIEDARDEYGFRYTEIVSGTATGVDQLGERWAKENQVPIKRFPADWEKHGKAAGVLRNREMANYADAVILVWDGKSAGTMNMLDEATRKGLLTHLAVFPKVES